MPIKFPPHPGTIVRCSFENLEEGEMTKARPVVILSPREERNFKPTCVVVCLSTTEPSIIKPYHLKIQLPGVLPKGLSQECWVKGDMVYAVSLKRMDFYRFPRSGKDRRDYYYDRLSSELMKKPRKAVGCAIGM